MNVDENELMYVKDSHTYGFLKQFIVNDYHNNNL